MSGANTSERANLYDAYAHGARGGRRQRDVRMEDGYQIVRYLKNMLDFGWCNKEDTVEP